LDELDPGAGGEPDPARAEQLVRERLPRISDSTPRAST
jgi:hypothetical protein